MAQLVAAFRQADFFSLLDAYEALITDNSASTLSIEFDNHRKSVKDYLGFAAGMPEAVLEVEREIDRIGRGKGWLR